MRWYVVRQGSLCIGSFALLLVFSFHALKNCWPDIFPLPLLGFLFGTAWDDLC